MKTLRTNNSTTVKKICLLLFLHLLLFDYYYYYFCNGILQCLFWMIYLCVNNPINSSRTKSSPTLYFFLVNEAFHSKICHNREEKTVAVYFLWPTVWHTPVNKTVAQKKKKLITDSYKQLNFLPSMFRICSGTAVTSNTTTVALVDQQQSHSFYCLGENASISQSHLF